MAVYTTPYNIWWIWNQIVLTSVQGDTAAVWPVKATCATVAALPPLPTTNIPKGNFICCFHYFFDDVLKCSSYSRYLFTHLDRLLGWFTRTIGKLNCLLLMLNSISNLINQEGFKNVAYAKKTLFSVRRSSALHIFLLSIEVGHFTFLQKIDFAFPLKFKNV